MATKSTALVALTGSSARVVKPNKRDMEMWRLSRRSMTPEQIAGRFNVKEIAVFNALQRVQLYRDQYANEEIDLAVNQMISSVIPQATKVLGDAMKAEVVVQTSRGKKIILKKVADHATRMKAVDTVKTLMEATRPKGGGMTFNQQINTERNAIPAPGLKGFSFEERLRKARADRGLTNEEDVAEAEYEETEQTTAAEELAEIGIDIDEGEEENDDEGLS